MVSGKKPDMSNGSAKHRDQNGSMSYNRNNMGGGGKPQNGMSSSILNRVIVLTISGNASSFRTDSAISGGRNQGERVLVPWVPDAAPEVDGSLESGRMRNAAASQWDQFAENERRFGVTSDYREEIYTTAINKAHPQYKQRLAEADQKAKEIERSTTTNSHVAEERIVDNLATGDNGDEEDK